MVPPPYTIRVFCLTNCRIYIYQVEQALHVNNFKRAFSMLLFVV